MSGCRPFPPRHPPQTVQTQQMFGFSKTAKYIENQPANAAVAARVDPSRSRVGTFVAELGERRYLSLFIALAVSTNMLALAAVYTVPDVRRFIRDEDNLVENLTVLAFLIALAGAIYLLARNRVPQRFKRWVWFIGPVALLGTLDELSFGQRIFSLNSINFRGVGIDAVHDFLGVGYDSLHQQLLARPFITIAIAVLLTVIGIALVYRARHWIVHRFTRSTSRECWAMLGVFLAALTVAQFLDLDILPFFRGFFVLVEELLELDAAILLVFMLGAITDPLHLYRRASSQ